MNNGRLSDEELLKVSAIDIQNPEKYTDEDRKRHKDLFFSERLKRYQEHPEQFVELSEVILLAIRNPMSNMGLSILIGHCSRSELNNAQIELNSHANKRRALMDIESEMKKQGKIMPAKHGILNFARRKK